MITQHDRDHIAWLKQRLAEARKDGNATEYDRIYNDMLRYANMLVADQRWWEIGSKEEAFQILRDILAIPPYLGHPTRDQLQRDVVLHRGIGKNLDEQIESIERTEVVVQTIDYAASAAGIVLGVGTFAVGAKELVKRVGLRKAGELIAEQLLKEQIKQEIQDQVISGLADAAGVDPELIRLVQAVKDAKDVFKKSRGPRTSPVVAATKSRPEIDALKRKAASLQRDQKWIQHDVLVTRPARRPKFRESTKQALGPLQPGQERRHFVPWEMMEHTTAAGLTDDNWKRIAAKLGYDTAKFSNVAEFKSKLDRDLFNNLPNVWKGTASGNPRVGRQAGEARIDWGIWVEKRESILDSVLTDQNWKRWAQREGYNPADFKDMRDFKERWFQDWRHEFRKFLQGESGR
jgi:hypothetical protein